MSNGKYLWAGIILLQWGGVLLSQTMPLPEHPRPDIRRDPWVNLNGSWDLVFDPCDRGIVGKWFRGDVVFPERITVPFPWGSKLSGVEDRADIAWYRRTVTVNRGWANKRTFLIIGASDWQTDIWLDGHPLGRHQGGYTPFEFELTPYLKYDQPQTLVVRVDDKRRPFTLYGKQHYGNARGIWQTVYLEARGDTYLDHIAFVPDIKRNLVRATAYLPNKAPHDLKLSVTVHSDKGKQSVEKIIPAGQTSLATEISIPNARLWTLDDPYLHKAEVRVENDRVETYFGMREISIRDLPGTDYPYVALNGKPIYLQMALDQSYHPEGFYTFPSDAFMRREVERAKQIGLNGIRPHIKVEIPRKLYWADRLGVLVMADLPNNQDPPCEAAQRESEYTLREMIKRDFNHPAIFSWAIFNESWGLRSERIVDGNKKKVYLPQTQAYVATVYRLAKSLDPTRLVDDNSIHSWWCAAHTHTDLNSSHDYLMGCEWEKRLKMRTELSYEGSTFQYGEGYRQGHVPSLNAECGNVWGYKGTTGDVDWSYDYHRMVNTFRIFPEMAGWLYTEHHDVIKEWNGYWRYDRSLKFTGVEDWVAGMTIKDFHAPVYISTGNEICRTVEGGQAVTVPLVLSSMTDHPLGNRLTMDYELWFTNAVAEGVCLHKGQRALPYRPYIQEILEPLLLTIPDQPGLGLLKLYLKDAGGNILHRNFMHFDVHADRPVPGVDVVTLAPREFSEQSWSLKQWDVFDGLKVNGAGLGFFEYSFTLPNAFNATPPESVTFLAELSAKAFYIKDMNEAEKRQRGLDLNFRRYPDSNPNAYPMTDEATFPSTIDIHVNGVKVETVTLPDDPADHRGVLSWHRQVIPEPRLDQTNLDNWWYTLNGTLNEAGSYGYLVRVPIPRTLFDRKAEGSKTLVVRLQTSGEGGLAVYGRHFGRYPLDPSLVITKK